MLHGEEKLLTVAKCYGFRNIQNLVRKLKQTNCDYDYVEIMACPSGCINGGGQIRGASADEKREVLIALENISLDLTSNMEDVMERVKEDWTSLNPKVADLLRTHYRRIERSINNGIISDW